MNEVKRQLNKKMGDTKKRAETVIMKVEQNKQPVQMNKKSSVIYYITFATFTFAILISFIFIFNPLKSPERTTAPAPTAEESNNQQSEVNFPLKAFFKQHEDVAYFVGDFGEYSSFTETTTWLSEEFVQIFTDNGGGTSQKIYKVTHDSIELIYDEMPEFTNPDNITVAYLKTLEPISTLFKWPVENGSTFGNKVVTYPVEFITPYKTFNNVIQITHKIDSSKTDYYYAENYGLIGRVSTLDDGLQIHSLLTAVNGMPTEDKDATVQLFNKTTNQEEAVPFHLFSNFDPLFIYKPELETTEITYEMIYDAGDRELGIVEFNPAKNFSIVFVERTKDTIQLLGTHHGELIDWKFSPNKKQIAFHFSNKNVIEAGIMLIDYLTVIDLDVLRFTSFIEEDTDVIFNSSIVSYKWLDNNSIQYMVPDIVPGTLEDIIKWQQATDQPTKPRVATLK